MSQATIAAFAWSLIHFLWQGAAVALAAGVVNVGLNKARPATRYAVWCAALAIMALAPLATFLVLQHVPPSDAIPHAFTGVAGPAAIVPPTPNAPADVVWPSWLVAAWLIGVSALAVRALGGWIVVQRLARRGNASAPGAAQRAATTLCERLRIRRAVRVLVSVAMEVPATIGALRPIVLLPVYAVTSLTPEQLELLIAHELAHVRRHDYLVNLVQTFVETVLFYHPAVFWVSRRIRAEREHCCDDLAVAACGDVALYVETLAALELRRPRRAALAVAADGGSLLARIQRLLGREPRSASAPPWLAALIPLAIVAAIVGGAAEAPSVAVAKDQPAKRAGFLGGLADAGYDKLSIDEVIALREQGVEPDYVKSVASAGLGRPTVTQLIELRQHGVDAAFMGEMVHSAAVSDLDFSTVIRLRENGVDPDELAPIRALGFGPFTASEAIRLRQSGVAAESYEALKAAGISGPRVEDAIAFRQNGVTVANIRSMKEQGFGNLSLEQIVKLHRAGVI